jgi:hypothetical protein
MDWRSGSRGRAPALQAQSPEFPVPPEKKEKKMNSLLIVLVLLLCLEYLEQCYKELENKGTVCSFLGTPVVFFFNVSVT